MTAMALFGGVPLLYVVVMTWANLRQHRPGRPSPRQEPAMSTRLDLSAPEFTDRFASSPLFIKSAVVSIREVPPGTVVQTTLADGTDETTITADEDRRFEVTNPDGEKYLITEAKVRDRYLSLGDGRYQAKGAVRAFHNPVGADITITAPWGSDQHGGPDAFLAVAVDPERPDDLGLDRYIIGGAEFASTYVEAPEAVVEWARRDAS